MSRVVMWSDLPMTLTKDLATVQAATQRMGRTICTPRILTDAARALTGARATLDTSAPVDELVALTVVKVVVQAQEDISEGYWFDTNGKITMMAQLITAVDKALGDGILASIAAGPDEPDNASVNVVFTPETTTWTSPARGLMVRYFRPEKFAPWQWELRGWPDDFPDALPVQLKAHALSTQTIEDVAGVVAEILTGARPW